MESDFTGRREAKGRIGKTLSLSVISLVFCLNVIVANMEMLLTSFELLKISAFLTLIEYYPSHSSTPKHQTKM